MRRRESARESEYARQMVLTRSNALPNVHSSSLDIPYGALRVHRPVNVDFPGTRGVADKPRHSVTDEVL